MASSQYAIEKLEDENFQCTKLKVFSFTTNNVTEEGKSAAHQMKFLT